MKNFWREYWSVYVPGELSQQFATLEEAVRYERDRRLELVGTPDPDDPDVLLVAEDIYITHFS